jgi:hypothetical protein
MEYVLKKCNNWNCVKTVRKKQGLELTPKQISPIWEEKQIYCMWLHIFRLLLDKSHAIFMILTNIFRQNSKVSNSYLHSFGIFLYEDDMLRILIRSLTVSVVQCSTINYVMERPSHTVVYIYSTSGCKLE